MIPLDVALQSGDAFVALGLAALAIAYPIAFALSIRHVRTWLVIREHERQERAAAAAADLEESIARHPSGYALRKARRAARAVEIIPVDTAAAHIIPEPSPELPKVDQ